VLVSAARSGECDRHYLGPGWARYPAFRDAHHPMTAPALAARDRSSRPGRLAIASATGPENRWRSAAAVLILGSMLIRDATPEDWPAIWSFMRGIAAAGETFSWDRDISEQDARGHWLRPFPGRAVVAVDSDGTILGTAESGPNHGGPAAHVASAGFMVDPAHSRRGVGRALGEHVLEQARADGYRAMQFNAVVESNVRAVSLWRSLGFEILTTVPEAFNHPADGCVGLHIMYRRL
jgi:GNAT superfamily N-acetyltransferase